MVEHLTSPKVVKKILTGKNLAPRKSLGQNFLIDTNIRQKIVDAAHVDKKDLVLEIGPGLGALTELLQKRAGKVIAVEYDKGLYQILHEFFGNKDNLILINQDFLKTDLDNLLDIQGKEVYHYKVVANLPYYITTPVIFKLFESGIVWETIILLVQKEVADRICAGPANKEYGALTVMVNFHGRPEKIMNVSKTVFYPAPQVDSAVIRITAPFVSKDENTRRLRISPYLHRVVQAVFGQRRKTVLNALNSLELYLGDKQERNRILQKLGIDPLQRGETLTLDNLLDIAKEMQCRDGQPD